MLVAQPIAALFGFAKKHFAFFRGFFARRFLAIVDCCPHISRLGRGTEPKRRLPPYPQMTFIPWETDQLST